MTQSHINKFEWVGSIETVTGREFNVVNPTLDMFHFEDVARSLSMICRYNGHVPSFYSVAEHSVRVAWQLKFWGYSLELQMTGLLHDAAEAYVGDMVRPLKRLALLGGLHKEMEDQVASLLHQKFGGIFPYPDAVHHADREVYNWEVKNIRTGLKTGWTPEHAYDAFNDRYRHLTSDLHRSLEHRNDDEDLHTDQPV